jgi:hypothetical protein
VRSLCAVLGLMVAMVELSLGGLLFSIFVNSFLDHRWYCLLYDVERAVVVCDCSLCRHSSGVCSHWFQSFLGCLSGALFSSIGYAWIVFAL